MGSDADGLEGVAKEDAIEASNFSGPSHREFCGNCGTKFSSHFCSDCGEERDTHRRSLARLLHDLIEDVLSFDSRILRTANALIFRPGELSCAFREGRLRRYVPPIRLYFFATLLFFLTLGATGVALMRLEIIGRPMTPALRAQIASRLVSIEDKTHSAFAKVRSAARKDKLPLQLPSRGTGHDNIYIVGTKGQAMIPSLQADFFVRKDTPAPKLSAETKKFLAQARLRLKREQTSLATQKSEWGIGDWILGHAQRATLVLERDPDAVNGPLMTWIPRALFLLLPIFAALLALFYLGIRRDFYFVDHLVFSLNLHSFVFIVLTLVAVLTSVGVQLELGWFAFAAVGIYMLLAMKRFYGQSWIKTSLKFFSVSVIYFFIIFVPALFIVATVSALES